MKSFALRQTYQRFRRLAACSIEQKRLPAFKINRRHFNEKKKLCKKMPFFHPPSNKSAFFAEISQNGTSSFLFF